jgi:O-antigen/teichoic acid export membrane protein
MVREPVVSIAAAIRWNRVTKASTELWEANSVRGRFARGAVWSLIGALISQGATLAASVITARLLGRERFGEFGMIQSTVGMFGILAGMGLGLTATKYVAELRARDPARAGRIVALGTAVALITATVAAAALFVAAPWLAANTLNAAQLSPELRIAAGLLFLNALSGTQTGILAGFEAFRAIARVSLARGVVTFPLTVSFVLLWGLRGAVTSLATAAIVGLVLNHVAIHAACRDNGVPVCWRNLWAERLVLWKFSLPAFLSGAMTSPAVWAANSILVNQRGGYAEMGVFSAANQWRMAVAFLPALLAQPVLSMLSNLATTDARSFGKLLRANLYLNVGLSVSIAAPVILFAARIMNAYGRDFSSGAWVLILLAGATAISSVVSVMAQAMASLDRVWWGFALNSAWALALLASAALLAPRYGAVGLAGAYLASYLVHAVTVSIYVRLHLRTRLVRADSRPERPLQPDGLPHDLPTPCQR